MHFQTIISTHFKYFLFGATCKSKSPAAESNWLCCHFPDLQRELWNCFFSPGTESVQMVKTYIPAECKAECVNNVLQFSGIITRKFRYYITCVLQLHFWLVEFYFSEIKVNTLLINKKEAFFFFNFKDILRNITNAKSEMR